MYYSCVFSYMHKSGVGNIFCASAVVFFCIVGDIKLITWKYIFLFYGPEGLKTTQAG